MSTPLECMIWADHETFVCFTRVYILVSSLLRVNDATSTLLLFHIG